MFDALAQLASDKDRVEVIKLVISTLGLVSLIGIFAALLSMRVTVCHQLYSRWQSLLFKFADVDKAYESLATEYSRTNVNARTKAHFIAVAYLNLFEEAFRYRHARFAFVWRVLPKPFWNSIVKSMTKLFSNYPYLRSLWVAEKDSFSSDFNAFIDKQILPACMPCPPVVEATVPRAVNE